MVHVKTCIHCAGNLPLSEFYKHPNMTDGLDSKCRVCAKAAKNKYYYKKREKVLEGAQDYRSRKGPEHFRKKNLEHKYGISLADYERMFTEQGGLCAICKSPSPGRKDRKHFSVDHCHKTGKVRGLLCSGCNTGIGNLKDSVDILESSITYLRKWF